MEVGRAAVGRALAEILEARGISDELLSAWEHQELRAFSRCSVTQERLSPPLRCLVFDILACMNAETLRACKLQACSYKAIQVFDLCCKNLAMEPPHKLFACAAAAWMVSMKLEVGGQRSIVLRGGLGTLEVSASHWSGRFGGQPVSASSIRNEEVALLNTGLSGLAMPTLSEWVNVFLERVDVATRGVFHLTSERVRALGAWWTRLFARSMPASADQPPRLLALGLCGAVLLAVDVLPAEALQPLGIEAEAWRRVVAVVTTASCLERFPPHSPPLQPRVALAAMCFAARCEPEAFRGSTLLAVDTLQALFASYKECLYAMPACTRS